VRVAKRLLDADHTLHAVNPLDTDAARHSGERLDARGSDSDQRHRTLTAANQPVHFG
jgi:hypothetical protein